MIRNLLLPEFDQEIGTLRSQVVAVPDTSLDWRPHPKSYSLRELLSHLVNIPTWLPLALETEGLDMTTAADWKAMLLPSTAKAIESLDENAKLAKEKLGSASYGALMEPWTLRAGPHVILSCTKFDVARTYVINHLVHHRGQLSVYLRLLDVPLPKIYGPTADAGM